MPLQVPSYRDGTVVIDNTLATALGRCPRYALYTHGYGFRGAKDTALVYGAAAHVGVQTWLTTRDLALAEQKALEAFKVPPEERTGAHTELRLLLSIRGYAAKWGIGDSMQLYEHPGGGPWVEGVITNPIAPGVVHVGMVDALVSWRGEGPWVWDLKTSRFMQPEYIQTLHRSGQFRGYMEAVKAVHKIQPKGCIVDLVGKPDPRMVKEESLRLFFLGSDKVAPKAFAREVIPWSDEEQDDWRRDIIDRAEEWRLIMETGPDTARKGATPECCYQFFRSCPFLGICGSPRAQEEGERIFGVKHWDPLEERR